VTIEEALAFVAAHPHVFLLTRRADGFPTAYAMTAIVEGRSVLFSTYGVSAKVRNLLREGVASVLASDEDGGTEVVEVTGPVRLAEPGRGMPHGAGTPARGPGLASVPAEVVDAVRNRHDRGRRVVVELLAEQARGGTSR